MTEKLPIKWDQLRNRSAIITGGASGLGLATATLWAEHGAYVTLADRDEATGQAAAAELTNKGYRVTFVQCDTTDWDSSVAAFKHAANFSPRKTLDIAALFAGVGGDAGTLFQQDIKDDPEPSLESAPTQPSERIIDINLNGVLKSTKLALYYFRVPAQNDDVLPGRKSLFLVSSLAGYVDYSSTNYSTAKYGVRGLFRTLRRNAYDPKNNFRINLVAPGYHATPMVLKHNPGDGARQKAIQAAVDGGFVAPNEYVANAATLAATNEDVNGRTFLTVPSGFYDMEEDLDKGYGGQTLRKYIEDAGYVKAGFVG